MNELPRREVSGNEIALMQAEVVHDILARRFKPYSFEVKPVTEDKECYVVQSCWPGSNEVNMSIMIEKTGREKGAFFLMTSRATVKNRSDFNEFCKIIETKTDEHIFRFKNRQKRVA